MKERLNTRLVTGRYVFGRVRKPSFDFISDIGLRDLFVSGSEADTELTLGGVNFRRAKRGNFF